MSKPRHTEMPGRRLHLLGVSIDFVSNERFIVLPHLSTAKRTVAIERRFPWAWAIVRFRP